MLAWLTGKYIQFPETQKIYKYHLDDVNVNNLILI